MKRKTRLQTAETRYVDAVVIATRLSLRLQRIADIIERVENRCMATDGPVTDTRKEITKAEMRRIYKLAKVFKITSRKTK